MVEKLALVTGASSGIGELLARHLARDGNDLVLVARTLPKLEALAAELEREHSVRARVIAADLSDRAAPAHIFGQVESWGLSVDVLVNNAGFGSRGDFLGLDLSQELGMIQVNIASLVELTHRFGKGMRARGSGRVLNIASTAGMQPGPYMATYYATKAFVISFSLALSHEWRGSGVTVTCHCPGATATGFAERAGNGNTRLFQRPGGIASAEAVAEHAYRAMLAGKRLSVHGALNRVAALGSKFLPSGWVTPVVAGLNRDKGEPAN